jgi:hypothetical protein
MTRTVITLSHVGLSKKQSRKMSVKNSAIRRNSRKRGMNVSATSLSKLISTRKEELAKLWELRGTNFPAVERQKDLRISFIELELADLEKLNRQPQLNENQQEMLQEVIKQYDITKPKTVLHALEHLSMIAFLLDEMDEVTEEDCIVVAQAFLDWAQEQEEE